MPEYHKLIRDNIPDEIRRSGNKPIMRVASSREYLKALADKLHEEVVEFLEDQSAEEAADVIEVLYAICALSGIEPSKIEETRRQKAIRKGKFEKRIILDEVKDVNASR